jgi:hypothetical protein
MTLRRFLVEILMDRLTAVLTPPSNVHVRRAEHSTRPISVVLRECPEDIREFPYSGLEWRAEK